MAPHSAFSIVSGLAGLARSGERRTAPLTWPACRSLAVGALAGFSH